MSPDVAQAVCVRAGDRCEYCHMPDAYEPRMHVDHIIAAQHGGAAVLEWDGSELRGRTQVGHVTIQVLAINARNFRAMRATLMEDGAYDWAQ